jgi:dolichol-phosphate mannosyltransferase
MSMNPPDSRTLVAVITYNEGEKLRHLLSRFPEDTEYDVLVVDDGSTDGTQALLREQGRQCIRHEENRGVGAAIRGAIGYGRSRGYELIVIMAGNGKMLPAEIPTLLEPLLVGKADYVQGSRYLGGERSPNLPTGRKLAIKAFTAVANLLLGFRGTDITCGFRAYRLDLFDDPHFRIDQSWLDRYELEYYVHYKAVKLGYRLCEVPVSMIYPEERRNYSKIKAFTGWWSIIRPWIFLTLRLRR